MAQWYKSEQGAQRLLWECRFVQEDFPNIQVVVCEDGYVRANGILGPSNLSPRQMFIAAVFPASYPSGRIKVYAPDERFPSNTPHIYPGSGFELCLDHNDFTPDDTLSTVLGWTLQWIALYDNFLATGERW